MKYVVSMNFLRNGSASENKAAQRELLDLFSKWKQPENTTFHEFLGRVDGGGTFAVIESDNPADLIDTTSKFGAFVEYQVYPCVEIADAVQAAHAAQEFMNSTSA
jgi:hypothetical protein